MCRGELGRRGDVEGCKGAMGRRKRDGGGQRQGCKVGGYRESLPGLGISAPLSLPGSIRAVGGGGVPKAHPHYGDCPQHWLCLAPPGEAPPARPQSRCGGTDLWQPPRPGGREGLEGPASLRGHRILLPSPWLRLYLGRRLRLAFTPPPPRQPHTDTRTSSTDGHTAVHPGLVHRHGWAHTGMLTGTDKHRPTHACNTCMTVHTHTHPPPPPQMWTDTDTPHAHNCAPACVLSNTPLDMFLRPRNYTVSLHPISAPSYPHHIPAPPSLPTISAPPYPHCIPKSALQPCTLIPAPLSLRPCIYTASLHPISVLSYPHHIPAPPSLHPHTYIASLHPQIFTVSLHPHPRTPTSTALSQPPPSLLTRPR